MIDINEIPAREGKLYVSAIFDCYGLSVRGFEMADNIKADICVSTIDNVYNAFKSMRVAVIHSDRYIAYDRGIVSSSN